MFDFSQNRLNKFERGQTNILIDIDSLYYIAACKGLQEIEIKSGIFVEAFVLREAVAAMDEVIDGYRAANCNVLLYSEPLDREGFSNFRYFVNRNYKGNRKSSKAPRGLKILKEFYLNSNPLVSLPAPFLETDDMLAYDYSLATRFGYECSIVSVDKDYKPLSNVHHYYLDVDMQVHDEFFWYKQCLLGDTADNIAGVKGVGEATAFKFFADKGGYTKEQMEEAIVAFCEKKGHSLEQLYRDFACLQLLTESMYVDASCIKYEAFGQQFTIDYIDGEFSYEAAK